MTPSVRQARAEEAGWRGSKGGHARSGIGRSAEGKDLACVIRWEMGCDDLDFERCCIFDRMGRDGYGKCEVNIV